MVSQCREEDRNEDEDDNKIPNQQISSHAHPIPKIATIIELNLLVAHTIKGPTG